MAAPNSTHEPASSYAALRDEPTSRLMLRSMTAIGSVICLYGALIVIDALVASLGIASVPFDIGPPMPRNWFPHLLVGLSVAGAGMIAVAGARSRTSRAALIGLVIALGAMYEIVLLDRLYAHEGRPALSDDGATLQDRIDRLYGSNILVTPPRKPR
jgi:hypothetical protein